MNHDRESFGFPFQYGAGDRYNVSVCTEYINWTVILSTDESTSNDCETGYCLTVDLRGGLFYLVSLGKVGCFRGSLYF